MTCSKLVLVNLLFSNMIGFILEFHITFKKLLN